MYEHFVSLGEKTAMFMRDMARALMFVQDTSNKKVDRLQKMQQLTQVLEYLTNIAPMHDSATALMQKFFLALLIKIRRAAIRIDRENVRYDDEIAFLRTMATLCETQPSDER